jgi:prolyl oligopeptidase
MKKVLSFLLLVILSTSSYSQKANKYPSTPKDSTFDIYFETKIDDPYQWMENLNDPRLTDWLAAQKKITDKQDRQQIHKESLLRQIVSIYRNSDRELRDDYIEKKNKIKILFEFKYESSDYDKTGDLLYRPKGQGNTYKYLVKIKNFSKYKNDKVVITNRTFSPKYNLTAIEMSHNGSDWREVYFFDLLTGKQLTDTLLYLRIDSEIVWDEEGVYYDRYNKP